MSLVRGQASLEYSTVVALLLLAVVPISFYAYTTYVVSNNLQLGQVVVSRIVYAADSAAAAGEGSKVKVGFYVPESSENLTASGREVLLKFRDSSGRLVDVYGVTAYNLSSFTFASAPGHYVFYAQLAPNGTVVFSEQ